nr:gag, pol and env protein precursor [Haemonchus contortus]
MDESMGDYKAQLLQAVSEVHERVREYNERVREKMKVEYDKRNKVDESKHPKVGDRVYMLSPNEKAMSSHPKLTCEWAGPFRVIETSDNSAVVSRIGENVEPIRVQFDMLRVVPPYIPDDRVDTVTNRGRRGRKPKAKVNRITTTCFRGADIRSSQEKGHLEFVCKEGCLKDVKLEELKGIQLPGALSKRPLGTLWNAWRIASIFIRTDIEMAAKIKFWKDGTICLDEEALQKVIRLAYEKCMDWTEFVCVTEGIKRHERIEDYGFEKTYDAALKKVKKEIEEEERAKRPIKEGSTAFAAPAAAALLEKDGPKRGISTRVAPTFLQLKEILNEWSAHAIWVIVWPLEQKFKEDEVTEVVRACERHFENGGRIVSAWPPVVAKNSEVWKKMINIWKLLDATLERRAGSGQFFRTANSKIEEGKIFCELGAPESCLSFYGTDCTVGCAKVVYETIKRRTTNSVVLPELKRMEPQLLRTAASERGGMWAERSWVRPTKRRGDLGGN